MAGFLKSLAVIGGVLAGLMVAVALLLFILLIPVALLSANADSAQLDFYANASGLVAVLGALFAIVAGPIWGGLRVVRYYRATNCDRAKGFRQLHCKPNGCLSQLRY
ncbi:MAG: hypothetical protein OXG24_02645 [Gammaproteobacteria bacterium]|nr:hypothetical protein [Gammaproteobacteria bacterium]